MMLKRETSTHFLFPVASQEMCQYLSLVTLELYLRQITGLELARVPRVPGTRQNSEHHLWHLRILWFLILTGTRSAHSM